jgi:hypothetical protein
VVVHRAAIRRVAGSHGVGEIRWWPAEEEEHPSVDFLVDGGLGSLRALRSDLERELGCQVAIYLADRAPDQVLEVAHELADPDRLGEA